MNQFAPISSIMTTKLITVNPEDSLEAVKKIFDNHRIHHIPVVRFKTIVGLVSKIDFAQFLGDVAYSDEAINEKMDKISKATVESIMTKRLGKLEPTDRINVALEIFNKNIFHALPVVDGDDLVGIVTTFDIIRFLSEEKPEHPEDVYSDLA